MSKIAIVGDLHIAPRASSRIDDYFESLLDKIAEISSICKHVIFLGDVFEKETLPLDYFQRFYNHLQYLKTSNNVQFYSIIGNHDIYNENESTLDKTSLGLCDLVGVIKVIKPDECLTIEEDITYNFYTSYVNPEKCKQDLCNRDFKETDILLLHQYYEEFDGLTYEDIKNLKCKRVFLGHEHKPLENGKLVLPNCTLYRCGSCGRNKADAFQLTRHIFYYILENNNLRLATVECMKPGIEVFTQDAYNQENLKKKKFITNINEVVEKYSNNIATQDKFSLREVLVELNTPEKCFQYINNLYSRLNEKFD